MYKNILVCVKCHAPLIEEEDSLRCEKCDSLFGKNKYGFIEFTDLGIATTTDDYAHAQEYRGKRIYTDYLKPYLLQEPVKRTLEVGCGIGQLVNSLIEDGYDAYGIDLPALSGYWSNAENSPQRFLACNATQLPFPDNWFDVTYSIAVIEHIGTSIGACTLASNYREILQQYADEMLRVTKPGGRIFVSCPNKSFPIDIQHGVRDALTPITLGNRIRNYIFEKTGMNIHQTWGDYHLVSYSECRKLFCGKSRKSSFTPLPLKGYFGFESFHSGFLKPFMILTNMYINNLPRILRSSFLNPYLLVEIRK
jgi:SAM-dependent methyltransferase